MARFVAFFLIANVLMLSSCKDDKSTTPEPAETGDLFGHVSTGYGTAVPGTRVCLINFGDCVYADDRGWYDIKDIPEGRYTIVASASGYARYMATLRILSGREQQYNIRLDQQ